MILNGKQIRHLAEFAGFTVSNLDEAEEYDEFEYQVFDCPKEGVMGDDGVEYYEKLAILSEYPEEGSYPLGDPIDPPVTD